MRALEAEVEKSREREERHQRRADVLLQEVARLREEVSESKIDFDVTQSYGLRVVPANPPPSSQMRFKPVYGEVKSPIGGAEAPIAALGAF